MKEYSAVEEREISSSKTKTVSHKPIVCTSNQTSEKKYQKMIASVKTKAI